VKTTNLGLQVQPQANTSRASLVDLVCVLVVGMLLMGLVVLCEFSPEWAKYLLPLRIPLGIFYVLFAPGYLLQSALFPHLEDLDGIERLGLSLGLSVGLIPLLALFLDRLPWGLHLWPIVIGQALLVVLLFTAAMIHRILLPTGKVFSPNLHLKSRNWWRGLEPLNRRLFLFAGAMLIFTSLAAAWIFLVPSEAKFMTEFYMLGPDGLAENFPRQAVIGQTLSVTIGVTNHERNPMEYRLEIWQADPWKEGRRQR